MTNKKYTDKDIISSLEIIATTRNCNECKIRNCKWGTCNCEQITANAALDLIKRQQAEIERLNKEIQITKDAYVMLQTKIDIIKTEAIKEFAERLKNEIINDTAYACDSSQHTGYYDYKIKIGEIPEYIDSIVKEMVGEEE